MKYIVTLNGKKYEVNVEKSEATVESVTDVRAITEAAPAAPVIIKESPKAPEPSKPQPVNDEGGEKMLCPMPGTILGVKLVKGQQVKEGDIAFILEAMKMENEIFVPRTGTVTEVYVESGSTVNTDDLLAVIK